MEFPMYEDYADETAELDYSDYSEPSDHLGGVAYSLQDVWNDCCLPSLEIFKTLYPIFAACFGVYLLRILFQCINRPVWLHFGAAAAGIFTAHHIQGDRFWILTASGIAGWLLLRITRTSAARNFTGVLVAVSSVLYILSLETFFLHPATANALRGSQMIFLMKLISLAFSESVVDLNFAEYSGFIFFPGTVIFGPWIPLDIYRRWSSANGIPTLSTVVRMLKQFGIALAASAACLLVSNCLLDWLIGGFHGRWIQAFRVAASFRFSHYFVGYVSEATLAATGVPYTSVTKPWKIELPRSLVEVVAYWSIPMRNWLREFVFLKARLVFSVSVALILTYSASSLLHGVNFQLSAVLLTLAVGTYVENELRRKLAVAFDACIEARACRNCSHRHTSGHVFVVLANLAFGGLAMFHLAYLGDMFDSSASAEKGYNYQHTLTKWSQLDFAGHYTIAVTFLFQWLI
ncbi:Protein-serine O-palmitoleoyltransferase porcupine [Hypsibius exemplaris]|uniref:Protein-serine O-palmitoleoyltransferase porcupine n=1 Tax=Hypsibius exemplaris TaxID=2072580 RepID=A0A1W0WLD4_HYPEX|nr:Protein-serine O-palmitoleoyltransferase porcupine [Hypsibius exemplaris]